MNEQNMPTNLSHKLQDLWAKVIHLSKQWRAAVPWKGRVENRLQPQWSYTYLLERDLVRPRHASKTNPFWGLLREASVSHNSRKASFQFSGFAEKRRISSDANASGVPNLSIITTKTLSAKLQVRTANMSSKIRPAIIVVFVPSVWHDSV